MGLLDAVLGGIAGGAEGYSEGLTIKMKADALEKREVKLEKLKHSHKIQQINATSSLTQSDIRQAKERALDMLDEGRPIEDINRFLSIYGLGQITMEGTGEFETVGDRDLGNLYGLLKEEKMRPVFPWETGNKPTKGPPTTDAIGRGKDEPKTVAAINKEIGTATQTDDPYANLQERARKALLEKKKEKEEREEVQFLQDTMKKAGADDPYVGLLKGGTEQIGYNLSALSWANLGKLADSIGIGKHDVIGYSMDLIGAEHSRHESLDSFLKMGLGKTKNLITKAIDQQAETRTQGVRHYDAFTRWRNSKSPNLAEIAKGTKAATQGSDPADTIVEPAMIRYQMTTVLDSFPEEVRSKLVANEPYQQQYQILLAMLGDAEAGLSLMGGNRRGEAAADLMIQDQMIKVLDTMPKEVRSKLFENEPWRQQHRIDARAKRAPAGRPWRLAR